MGLFVLAVFYTLYVTRLLLIPIVLAVLFSMVLAPAVGLLQRLRVPPVLGAAVVVACLVGVFVFGAYRLAEPAAGWLQEGRRGLLNARQRLERMFEPVERVTEAAREVERMAPLGDDGITVQLERPSLLDEIQTSTFHAAAALLVMLILLYLLLASGDLFLRKLVSVLPRLRAKVNAVEIARRTQQDISLYLSTITLVNVGLGAVVGFALHLEGMPNPVLWGVVVTLLNYIPYLGPVIGVAVIGFAALLTFESGARAVLPPLTYFVVNGIEGGVVTPMILGRRLELNPVVIFVALILWGWLWGVIGAFLAVPLVATLKIVCDHVEDLRGFGRFLGR